MQSRQKGRERAVRREGGRERVLINDTVLQGIDEIQLSQGTKQNFVDCTQPLPFTIRTILSFYFGLKNL